LIVVESTNSSKESSKINSIIEVLINVHGEIDDANELVSDHGKYQNTYQHNDSGQNSFEVTPGMNVTKSYGRKGGESIISHLD
jgi:hypothetical protein